MILEIIIILGVVTTIPIGLTFCVLKVPPNTGRDYCVIHRGRIQRMLEAMGLD